ncbi:hypothetical protein HY969_01145 [Candidatus Kaiserbacteria bacterium]|nr:hypothetical protein [Candidatus Kaiserbacteria bacterium]
MAKDPLEGTNNYKQQRYDQLLQEGFSREWIDKVTQERPSLYENPRAKIKGLEERGFKDPHKLITSSPAILGYAFENIDAKIKGLEERGFKDPHKLITSLPAILGYAFENIDAKIKGLEERGFKDPHKLITSLPAILGLAFENIDAKIKGLEERGFKDPHKLITSSPAILGYAFENIDRKIRLLYLIHGQKDKAVSELEKFPPLLGYKWRRLLFAIRSSNPNGLRQLITISPQLLAAAKGRTGSDSPTRLAAAARELRGLDTEQILAELVENKSIDPRLIRALHRI